MGRADKAPLGRIDGERSGNDDFLDDWKSGGGGTVGRTEMTLDAEDCSLWTRVSENNDIVSMSNPEDSLLSSKDEITF